MIHVIHVTRDNGATHVLAARDNRAGSSHCVTGAKLFGSGQTLALELDRWIVLLKAQLMVRTQREDYLCL